MEEKTNNGPNRRNDYGSSNRRKFLIGAGSVAAGGSALLGTAATTTFSLNDRGVSANVVTDSSGAIALTDSDSATDGEEIINYTNGELEIDFTEGGAEGVNVGSTVSIGNTADPTDDSAFKITNQSTDHVDLKIEFEGDGFVSSGSFIRFDFEDGAGITQTLKASDTTMASETDTTSVSYNNANKIAPGETVFAAIFVDADNNGSAITENLSGVLNLTATQA